MLNCDTFFVKHLEDEKQEKLCGLASLVPP